MKRDRSELLFLLSVVVLFIVCDADAGKTRAVVHEADQVAVLAAEGLRFECLHGGGNGVNGFRFRECQEVQRKIAEARQDDHVHVIERDPVVEWKIAPPFEIV